MEYSNNVKKAVNFSKLVLKLIVCIGIFFYMWAQDELHLNVLKEALFFLVSIIIMAYAILSHNSKSIKKQKLGNLLILFLYIVWLSRFYPVDTLDNLFQFKASNYILTLFTAISLFYFLGIFFQEIVSFFHNRLHALVYFFGVLIIIAISFDLFFLNKGLKKFRYPKDYHPYYTYNSGLRTYPYCNAKERWVEDLRNYSFQQKKPENTIRIILCGASTMWGHFQKDSNCLARILEEKLNGLGLGNKRFEVITMAYPGKYQLNELIDISIILPHWNPDLVISFNGFNEIWYGESDFYYEGRPYRDQQKMAARDTSILQMLFYRYLYLGAYFGEKKLQSSKYAYYNVREPLDYEPPRYYSYLRQCAKVLKSYNIPYIYSFCPTVYGKSNLTVEEQKFIENEKFFSICKQRRKLSKQIISDEEQINYDIWPTINIKTTLFKDSCHFNDKGIELIAGNLSANIPKWLKK